MGSELRVGDIMTKEVVVAPPGTSIYEIAKIMKENEIGSIIILENSKERHPKGIVTERDLVYKIIAKSIDPKNTFVEEIMSSPLSTVQPEVLVEEAAALMKEKNIKRLPVVNHKKELVGIISETDLMKMFPIILELLEERGAI